MVYVFVTRIQCHGLCICNKDSMSWFMYLLQGFNVMVYVFVTRIQCHDLCICNKDSMSWFMYL